MFRILVFFVSFKIFTFLLRGSTGSNWDRDNTIWFGENGLVWFGENNDGTNSALLYIRYMFCCIFT
jgi:hypothetical protein